MSGGLMQIVAYGSQDIYLTSNPQITFFKIVYRRHTNFALESIQQTFNGQADFGKKVTCTISRNGDLITRTYLQIQLPHVPIPMSASAALLTGFRWVDWVGHVLIKNVMVEIGGQQIDKHYSDWLHIWNELSQTAGHAAGYASMVGNTPDLTSPIYSSASAAAQSNSQNLYIPLQFWFCRNVGLALPLIALQYHEVKINLEFNSQTSAFWAGTLNTTTGAYTTNRSLVTVPSLSSASLWVDYVYLDSEERKRFASMSHEYIIEQLQFPGDESTSNTNYNVKMNFNHPVKELIWVVQPLANVDLSVTLGQQWFNYTDQVDYTLVYAQAIGSLPVDPAIVETSLIGDLTNGLNTRLVHTYGGGVNPVNIAKIQLNGHDRFYERDGRYFNYVQPYQHHTATPALGINVYSFALFPENHQPSGSCNMSRIDNAVLSLKLSAIMGTMGANIRVFAVNYNVLRLMAGMGGLAYSN